MRRPAKAVVAGGSSYQLGVIGDGQFLKRQGDSLVGADMAAPGGSEAFPVGSVFLAVVDTSPATLLGYGEWSAFAAGRMLVGVNSGDSDFDAAEKTGGSKTSSALIAHTHSVTDGGHTHTQNAHTHTQDAHTHTQNSHNHTQDAHTHTQNSHTHTSLQVQGGTTAATTGTHIMTSTATGGSSRATSSPQAANSATATNQNATATNQAATAVNQNATATNQNATAVNQSATTGITATNSAGSGASFSLMNPFITVYMWKRTA